jgi:DNA-binding transcriptional regulator YdaS (Cro superfamily)
VLAMLRDEILKAGSQSAWARLTGIHRTALSAALNGRKGLQPKIVAALGLQKVEAYIRR